MFLHIGGDVMIPLKDLVGLIALDSGSQPINLEFLKTAEEEGFVVQLTGEPASLVICTKQVYLSPISTQTLAKRARKGYEQTESD
ncbi:MAG: DUF370 domain-containing protein [Limnochordia bacterium]|jgi:hypothetical protein|nr:DUF370 domain-containing protein [Limnochordia bacterium]MDI9466065.1 DUF370 domain-containing protein [Bacillota bacterium]NLO95775.1 DUF370 domain-containing protein [Bacillota bacterium]HOB40459.1 DUF370 domain-containing protein [Limnochordia bacterium]HOK32496.1 DUF370 domain-containing protein [Limnochordia bacterium]